MKLLSTLFIFLIYIALSCKGTELDTIGGWKDIQETATGWFHIEPINGRNLLRDDGTPYELLVGAHQHDYKAAKEIARKAAQRNN
jgi:hypothetical protein